MILQIGDFTTEIFATPSTRSTIMYWAQVRKCASGTVLEIRCTHTFSKGNKFPDEEVFPYRNKFPLTPAPVAVPRYVALLDPARDHIKCALHVG